MEIRVEVDSEQLLIRIDEYILDAYEDFGREMIDDAHRKAMMMKSYAYEIERRAVRVVEIDKRKLMAHWRRFAVLYANKRGVPSTSDHLTDIIAMLFSQKDLGEKIADGYFLGGFMLMPGKTWGTWPDFFNDPAVSKEVKAFIDDMFSKELQNRQTYDKVIDQEARLLAIARTLKAVAEIYRLRAIEEGQIKA